MNGFGALWDRIYRFFDPQWDYNQQRTIGAFRNYLNGGQNTTIRMWVDGSQGSGHQASTVNILRQLSSRVNSNGFGYSGTIEVYYEPGAPSDPTLAKLNRLLPELGNGMQGQVGLAWVTLTQWTVNVQPLVNLGFTGGADDVMAGSRPVSPDFAAMIGTRYFLRLQPYLWKAPDQIQFTGPQPRPAITLTRQQAMGYDSFKQRAYYTDTVTQPTWNTYNGTAYAEQARIVNLLTPAQPQWDVCPVYSIRSSGNMQLLKTASARMFEVLTSVLASQRTLAGAPAPGARPVVVVSCDLFGTQQDQLELAGQSAQPNQAGLMYGGYASDEQMIAHLLATNRGGQFGDRPLTAQERARYQNDLKDSSNRRQWLTSIGAAARVRYVWNVTSATVNANLGWLTGSTDHVLFVQLGRIPAPLFNWLMQSSGWPPVFEGQNTSNVALNTGKPYFHIARPGSPEVQYPTTIIGYEQYERVETDVGAVPYVFLDKEPRQVQDAANWLTSPVSTWSPVAARNPAESTASLVRAYRAEGTNGPLHTYFRKVRDFYSVVSNDKLRLGTSFLQYVIQGGRVTAAGLAAGEPPVLEKLLDGLRANTTDGTLHVAPGAFTEGDTYSFYTGLLGTDPGLALTGSALQPEYDRAELVAITATGAVMFSDVPLTARIRFTAPEGIVVTQARYTYDQRWTLEQIPWIGFRSPFVEFFTADEAAPLAAAVGGTLDGLDLELAFRLPAVEGKWQLAGSFREPYPGIERFFQLAGGVDLIRSLPTPFGGLAGFGLETVRLVYDLESRQVENTGFRFSTSDGFDLLPGLRMREIAAEVVVQNPADLARRRIDWTVYCVFKLGKREDAGVIQLRAIGPGLVLSGSLLKGTLRITDIIDAFSPGLEFHPPAEPEITDFQASFAPATNDFNVSCLLNIGWPVAVADRVIFTIDAIGFGVSRLAGLVQATLRGLVTIGSGESAVPLQLLALYGPEGWIFSVAQDPGSVISLSGLVNQFMPDDWRIEQDYGIAGLGLTVAVNQGSWEFTGRTAEPWTVPFISGLTVAAALKLGRGDGWKGRLETTWTWQNISILVYFDYSPARQVYGIVWNALEGRVEGPGTEGDWTATLTFTRDTTLGGMVETMVSWVTGSEFALEAPWSVLNSIPLTGLSLVYTFNHTKPVRESVAFDVNIGPIELGFARIDKVSVTYNSKAKQKVAVTLKGSFLWNIGVGAVGDTGTLGPWDASQPGTAPAPPGGGNKFLDLRLLALGQHVTVAGLPAATSIQQAIELMKSLPDPEPGRVPDVTFDAGSAWIVGADVGILRFGGDEEGAATGYVVTVQAIFNDPHLYGLRLALAGDAAKVFKGLDFQILYRQVSETVGVYQAELTLPDAMRHLTVGVYSLTLPVFAIAVYTNGDFQVDVGFPWNADFARSLTIEGIVYPGIPVLGSAGFYFGKLSSATTDRVPKTLNGTFNPVYVFGFGMQIGFGKSLEYGVLKAGFSVTAIGIIEGVLGTFNPYLPAPGPVDPAQVQDSYYFWLRGTFGIAGRLYGTIDFAVVKAEVNVSLSLLVQITFEAFASLSISVLVSVDVSVSISISLGLFSISISFSFSLRVKETFTLDNLGTPPWVTAGPRDALGPAERRLGHRRTPSRGLSAAAAAADRWQRLQPSRAGVQPLTAWLAPGITLAHDERDTGFDVARQVPCQVYLMLIETVADSEGTVAEVVARTATAEQTSFERLAAMVLRWVVAAGQALQLTPEQVDTLVVSAADLTYLLDVVLVSTDAQQAPMPPADIDSFLGRQFLMTADVPDGSAGQGSATVFPMPPGLRLTAPRYGPSYPGYDYVLAGYNALDDAAAARLRAYFDQLAVQVQDGQAAASARAATPPMSMAQWVQSDYFLLLARQMTQAGLDALRDFKYVIDGSAADHIVKDVNETGKLTGDDRISQAALFAANPGHPLQAGRTLRVGVTVRVQSGHSFQSVSTRALGSAVTATSLARANAGNEKLLRAGAVISYAGSAHTVIGGDSLITVARYFGIRLTDLLSGAADLLTDTGLLTPDAVMLAPLVTYQARAESTFDSIAALPAYASGFTAAALAAQIAGCPVLRAGQHISYGDRPPYQVRADDTLADVAAHFAVDVPRLLDGTRVLAQPGLLADAAVLALPPFGCTVARGDTIGTLASRFATTVQVLSMAPENGTVPGLFATQDAGGQPTPWLDIPHLVQYQVAAILEETRRTLGIRQLSRMAARYALHGTRLPTAGIEPKARGMWVRGDPPNLTLPPMAGLYALTGQQIDVPPLNAASGNFTVTVRYGAGPSWLRFAGDAGELAVTLAPGSQDATRLAQVVATGTEGPFDLGLTALGADPMYERHPGSYPLSTVTSWQSAAPVTLPYGPPPSPDQVQALRLRALPGALASLPGPGKSAPRFAVNLVTYDEATGGTVTTAVPSHGWATVVPFTVKRVPVVESSPATATTYEIVGAGGADVTVIERIVDQIGDDDAAFGPLLLAYASGDADDGLRTDAPDTVTLGISQVNLSSETRPSGAAGRASGRFGQQAAPGGLLNTRPAFIRLLWEASITRSGGFYLYYYDAGSGRGLPSRIFNDRGEAPVWLIVLYAEPAAPADADRLHDYMTAVVTGDAIDTSRSAVVADAAPDEPPVPADEAESLARLAWRTNSNVADIAEQNQALRLRPGVRLAVAHGVYQAPADGVPLATIVADLGLTGVAALDAANPRWADGLPDPLPFPVAINLPAMTLTAGTSRHTSSLADLADYYGTDLTTAAADNADVPGLFAAGQRIVIPGGPYLRGATVQPGATAVRASRPKPVPVPPGPGGDYAALFLLNTFSLLGYQVAGNVYFSASNTGLPAGPTPPGGDIDRSPDKVRVPPDSSTWEYRQSFGYSRFAIAAPRRAGTESTVALPPTDGDPYAGLGSILQVNYSWQDHYGNTLVTNLTRPAGHAVGPANQPPMLTGYTDPVISLNQWPSVATGWRAVLDEGQPVLELMLTFDPARYRGLLRAAAVGATQIRALFTDDLDPDSAGDTASYRLDGSVGIASAVLGADRRTVTLTTDRELTGAVHTLSATGLQGPGPRSPVYAGSATFPLPDQASGHSSTVTDAARRDLSQYASLYYQLTDTNGMTATVTASLLTQPADLTAGQRAALLGWLFTETTAIYPFLSDRAAGGTGTPAPPAAHRVAIPLAGADLNRDQIFRLSVAVTLRRTGGVVLGPLTTTPGIREATTMIAPLSAPLPPPGPAHSPGPPASPDTLGLEQFARDFEAALSVPDSYQLKLASGIDREAARADGAPAALWAVRLGTAAGEGISYRIGNPGEPELFAPRPISNQLQSRTGVAIYDYTTGTGISGTPSRYLNFTDIDMDVWGRALLAAVDETLTPEFTSAIAIVSARAGHDYLQQLLDQKKLLARAVSEWMIPLYAGEQADPGQVREVFYQQVLARLSNAYDIRAGIQFAADVVADIDDPGAQLPPRLFGAVADLSARGEPRSEITLTSPKLPLCRADRAPLPFLLSAPETVNADGAVVGAIDLDLTWRPNAIEHQIAEPDGITGYLASSWLSFVLPGDIPQLTRPLGRFPVPLVLRAFPANPTMTGHTGNAERPDSSDLAELTTWRYAFTWSLPFHYVQDRVHGLVEFNLRPAPAADLADSFPALAEFVTVYPRVRADLTAILARVDATTSDEQMIHDAEVALASLVDLLCRVTSADSGLIVTGPPQPLAGQAGLSYAFEVIEGSVELADPADPGRTVTALLVTIDGAPPPGVGTPVVLVDPSRYTPVRYAPDGDSRFSYYYADQATGEYLSQADGQKIADRTMTLPRLRILQRQDAWAGLLVKRNEQILPDHPPTAEPFVYTTPLVRFSDPLLPTVDSFQPVNIALIGPGPERPLEAHLAALFASLFADLPDDVERVTIGVETVYAYRINQALDPVELPIFLQAPLSVVVSGDHEGTTLARMVANWTAALSSWFQDTTPSTTDGTLRFDLAILSNLTKDPMPLLRLRDLRLALTDIVPPLRSSRPPITA